MQVHAAKSVLGIETQKPFYLVRHIPYRDSRPKPEAASPSAVPKIGKTSPLVSVARATGKAVEQRFALLEYPTSLKMEERLSTGF